MLRLLASAAAVAMLSTVAYAADLPLPEEPIPEAVVASNWNWTGFYGGVFGGWAFGEYEFDYAPPDVGGDTDGWLGGGEVGAQFQWNQFVLGVEADAAATGIEGSESCPNPAFDCDTEIDLFGTVRGRVGVAAGRFLFFGTGGLAYADVEGETTLLAGGAVPPSGTPTNGENNFLFGWTAGAGAEVQFANRWTLKGDWLFYDLGEEQFDIDNGLVVDVAHTGNMVRLHVTKLFP